VDHLILFCFAYDHTQGRYGPAAVKLMRVFGALTVLVLAIFLALNARRGEPHGAAGWRESS
jgi:hypothetical protein